VNVGAQEQQQICTTLSAIFFLFTQFLITFIRVSKEFRGTRRQLSPRAWTYYGPGKVGRTIWSIL